MIEPGRNGRRSGSVAKGRCEAGRFAKNGRPLARWILKHETGVRRARWGHFRDPANAAAAVAEHSRARSGKPVQTDLAKRGGRCDEDQRCRVVHALQKPERRTISPAPMSLGMGTGFRPGVDQPAYASPPVFRIVRFVLPFALR